MKKSIFIALVSIVLTSCYTRTYVPASTYLDKFVGLTENQLLQSLGAPSSTGSDGANGKMLTYTTTTLSTHGVILPYNRYTGYQGYSNTYANTQEASFFISNTTNKVYSYHTNIPDTVQKKVKVLPTILLLLFTAGVAVGAALAGSSN